MRFSLVLFSFSQFISMFTAVLYYRSSLSGGLITRPNLDIFTPDVVSLGGLASITCTSRKLSISLQLQDSWFSTDVDSRCTVYVGHLSSSVHQCSRTLSRPVPSVPDNLAIMATGTIVRIFLLKTISAGCYAGQKQHDNGQISLTSVTILCSL